MSVNFKPLCLWFALFLGFTFSSRLHFVFQTFETSMRFSHWWLRILHLLNVQGFDVFDSCGKISRHSSSHFCNWTEKCRISMLSRQYFDLNFAGRPTLLKGRNWLFAGATLELEHKELRHISKRISWLIFYKLLKILLKISVRMFKVMKVKILSGSNMKDEVWFVKYYVLPWPSFWAWLTIQSSQFTFQLASLHSRRQTTFSIFHQNLELKAEKSSVHQYHST